MRRRLLLECSALALFLAFVFGLLEWAYRDYRIGLDRQYAQFRQERGNARILWLGNSHIIPLKAASDSLGAIPSASLALVGMDLFWTRVLLERQRDSLPAVRTVVLYADPEILGYNQTLHGQAWVNRALYRYGDTLYNDRLSERWMARSDFFRSNRDLQYLFAPKTAGPPALPLIRVSCWLPLDDTLRCRERAKENAMTRFDRALFDENLGHLSNILRICHDRQWRVVLARTPKRTAFLRYFFHDDLRRAEALLDSVARRWDVPVFSTGWGAERDSLIADPDHLSLLGAFAYLEELAPLLGDTLAGRLSR